MLPAGGRDVDGTSGQTWAGRGAGSLYVRPCSRPFGELSTADGACRLWARLPRVGSLRLITLPNLWAHANCDHAMTSRLTPTDPQTARIEVLFLIREDAVEGRDYDPNAWRGGLKATSEQDWKPCENNHAGIRSTAYEPGPLSPVTENAVDAFEAWYLSELARRPAG